MTQSETPMILTISPDHKGYTWEAEVLFSNIVDTHSYPADKVTWITYGEEDAPSSEAAEVAEKYGIVHIHYQDDRPKKDYATSIRPWLWGKYLQEDEQRQHQRYFYIDTDVLFREIPDFTKMDVSPHQWYGSDTKQYSYISPNSVLRDAGRPALDALLDAVGIDITDCYLYEEQSAGVHWYIDSPTPEFFLDVYHTSERVYDALVARDDVPQEFPWLSDMWAFLWILHRHGISPKTHSELAFSTPHQEMPWFFKTKIYHNSGLRVFLQNVGEITFNKASWRNGVPEQETITVGSHLCSYVYALTLQKLFPTINIQELRLEER